MILRGSSVLLYALIWFAAPAAADGDVHADNEQDYFTTSVRDATPGDSTDELPEATSGGATSVDDGGSYITYEAICDIQGSLQPDAFGCDNHYRCGPTEQGILYYPTTHFAGGKTVTGRSECYSPHVVERAGAVTVVRPRITPAIVLRAFERVPVPESEVVVQPPGGQTLVGLDTIFSTEAEGFTETVTLLGRSVELDITPTSYRWRHGDSTEQTTDWPGSRWTRAGGADGYITHVYDDTARLATSVDTTWSARYRVGNGPWQEVPGTVTIEGDSAPLRVRSASPHLVGVADRG